MPNNNTLETAENIGILSSLQTFEGFVGTDDRNDFYRFSFNSTSDFSLRLRDLEDDVDVEIIADLDEDDLVDSNEIIRAIRTLDDDTSLRAIDVALGAGDYFVRLVTDGTTDNTNYSLEVSATTTPGTTATDPGNRLDTALDLGFVSENQTFGEFVGTLDRNDFYRFSLSQTSDFSLRLRDLEDDVDVEIIADLDEDDLVDSNEIIRAIRTLDDDTSLRAIDVALGAGDYFVRLVTDGTTDNTNYSLEVSATTTPGTTATDPGNRLDTALDLGFVSENQTFGEFVGTLDRNDFYRFSLTQDADFRLRLRDLSDDVDVELIDDLDEDNLVDSNEIIRAIRTLDDDTSLRAIDEFLQAGTYFIRLVTDGTTDNSNYSLEVSSTADPVNNPPVAVNDTATTSENAAVTIPILNNDNDPNGDLLQIVNFSTPVNGTVNRQNNGTPDPTDDQLVYIPNSGFTGTDSFTYTISDGNGNTSTATVDLTVNPGDRITLDVDGNGEATALTDGIIAVRYLFGLTGEPLTRDAVGAGATRGSSDLLINYLDNARETLLDVDGDGEALALTDGILFVRYLFGLRGEPLISGAVADNAQRNTPDAIEAHLQSFEPGAESLQLVSESDILSFG